MIRVIDDLASLSLAVGFLGLVFAGALGYARAMWRHMRDLWP